MFPVDGNPYNRGRVGTELQTAISQAARGLLTGKMAGSDTVNVLLPGGLRRQWESTALKVPNLPQGIRVQVFSDPLGITRLNPIVFMRAQNPGGVDLDMRRAYADRGNWPVRTIFGLAYDPPRQRETPIGSTAPAADQDGAAKSSSMSEAGQSHP